MLFLLIAATLQIEVRSKSAPIPEAHVTVNGVVYTTSADGSVTLSVPAGRIEITATKDGLVPVTATVAVQDGETQRVVIELSEAPVLEGRNINGGVRVRF